MTYETLLGRIVTLLRQAAAPTEESTERDGGFSYHAESHAFGVGLGLGVFGASTGNWRWVGAVIAFVFGINRVPELSNPAIARDLRQEPHYLLFGIAVGSIIGFIGGSYVMVIGL